MFTTWGEFPDPQKKGVKEHVYYVGRITALTKKKE